MTEFERILEQCLRDLEPGAANVDECLSRHPGHALQLEPVLLTAEYLVHGREARPSAAFKSRVRSKLIKGMQAHPHKSTQFKFVFLRLAASLAVFVLILAAAGTVYAQGALPGQPFYAWKLASENAWRAVSPDPVGTDLAIAQRRLDELIAVGDGPLLRSQALNAYLEVVARLQSELDTENAARILQVLDSQTEKLNSSGIHLPELDQPDQNILPRFDERTPTPMATPTFLPEIPEVNPTLSHPIPLKPTTIPSAIPSLLPEVPQVNPTDLPGIVPTVQMPPLLP